MVGKLDIIKCSTFWSGISGVIFFEGATVIGGLLLEVCFWRITVMCSNYKVKPTPLEPSKEWLLDGVL